MKLHGGITQYMQVKETTFQAVISTDGQHSFASFIYRDSLILSSFVDKDPNTFSLIIGFDSGDRRSHADVGKNLLFNNQSLEQVAIFRIDGNRETGSNVNF